MFGKPIAQALEADIVRLKTEGVPEGRHLEFKRAVPVSEEERKKQKKIDPTRIPEDRSWMNQGDGSFSRPTAGQ